MDFSKDKFMRMMVFFDLPVKTKEMMKQANKFRRTLFSEYPVCSASGSVTVFVENKNHSK